MSQEKVNKYKEQKANRKESMKKQKRAGMIRNCIAGVVLAAVLAWVGYSAVDYIIAHQPREEVDVDYASVEDYKEKLTGEENLDDIGAVEDDATVEVTE